MMYSKVIYLFLYLNAITLSDSLCLCLRGLYVGFLFARTFIELFLMFMTKKFF